VKRRRYILHGLVVAIVLIAMFAPAWMPLTIHWRYLLGGLATMGLFVVLALAIAAALVPGREEL
jgi:hypothetical protein